MIGADRRPERDVEAADDGGEHHLQRHRDAAHRVGRDEHLVLAVERAGERGHERAEHRDLELLRGHVDACRGRRVLVLRDRLHRVALHAAVDPAPDQQADRPDAERDQVPCHLVVELQRQQRAALGALRRVAERAAGLVARGGDDLQHDARQRQRHQREVVAGDAEAKAGIADDHGQRAGADQRDRNADPRRRCRDGSTAAPSRRRRRP